LTQIIVVLERDKLYGSLKKCAFFSKVVTFLRYIVTSQGVKDECKVETIRPWLVPRSIHDVRSFMGLPHSIGGSFETSAPL